MYQVFTTRELRNLGCSDRDVRLAVDCCLEPVARGRFAVKDQCDNPRHARIWEAVRQGDAEVLGKIGDVRDRLERTKILIRTRADLINRRCADSGISSAEIFSHLSAALLWEFVIVSMEKPVVEVIRTNTNTRHAHLIIRRRTVPAEHIARLGDTVVTSKERTLIDVARDYPLDLSVPMLDDALRKCLVAGDRLLTDLTECPEVRDAARVRTALGLADPRRESLGESIVAVRFHEIGVDGFEPQVEIVDDRGFFIARVDFLHAKSKTIVEFDGRIKYTLDGQDARDAFDWERERERQLRALGYHVIRVFWKDLWRRQAFTEIARIVAARTPAASTR